MAKLALSRGIVAFFVVLALSAVALWVVGNSPGLDNITVLAFKQPKTVFRNTIVLANLNLGETFSQDVPALTGTNLDALRETIVHSDAGSSRFRQVLRLSSSLSGNTFNGGVINYRRDPKGDVGEFLAFEQDDPIFEWEGIFSPGFESRIENDRAIDFEEVSINILGRDYVISRAEVSGNELTLRLFGPSYLQFTDDVSDSTFSRTLEVGGRSIGGSRIRFVGLRSGNNIRLNSIIYRLVADHKLGGDVLVPPKKGVRQYLREPAGMLNPTFEIIFGGLKGGLATAISPSKRLSGNSVMVRARGDDEYLLLFTNTRGQSYAVPLASLIGGSLRLGDDRRDLLVREGTSNTNYNIDLNDFFVLTSDDNIKAVTNVLEYDDIDYDDGQIYFVDLGGSKRQEQFDTVTRIGRIDVGGNSYEFRVDQNDPHSIVVDQNNDGTYDGSRADFVILGGARIQVGTVSGSNIDVDFRTPQRLFEDASGDEVINFDVTIANSQIELTLVNQGNLSLSKGKDRIRSGMTPFGVLFKHDDDHEPAELVIDFPTGGRPVAAFVKGGQAQGWVVVTLELDHLLAVARERQG